MSEKRCQVCCGELSHCGEMTSDEPRLDCKVCLLLAENAELHEAVKVLGKGISAADIMASQRTEDGSAYPTQGDYIPEYGQARSEINANPLAAAAVREAKEQA